MKKLATVPVGCRWCPTKSSKHTLGLLVSSGKSNLQIELTLRMSVFSQRSALEIGYKCPVVLVNSGIVNNCADSDGKIKICPRHMRFVVGWHSSPANLCINEGKCVCVLACMRACVPACVRVRVRARVRAINWEKFSPAES